MHFGLLRADSPLPLAPIPRRTSPPPATVVHHWPLPLPRNELRAPKRMKPCPHPISTTLLFSSLSFCLRSKIRTLVRKDDRAISIFLASTTRNDRFRPFSFFSAREFFPRKGRRVGNRRNRKEWKGRGYMQHRCILPFRAIVTRTATTEKKEWEERRWKAMKNGDTQSRPGRQPPGSRPSRNNAKQTASGGGY